MDHARIKVESTGAQKLDTLLGSGMRDRQDINAIATRRDGRVSILVWNYSDDEVPDQVTSVGLKLEGLPNSSTRVLTQHYRIDKQHRDAFTTWKAQGSPQNPSAEQYSEWEAAGQLHLLESPRWLDAEAGAVEIGFPLPRNSISLLQMAW
jgi:xylan 1,4-beta-xylosidase